MRLLQAIVAGVSAVWFASSAVAAVSITNRDDHDQKITIIERSEEHTSELQSH